MKTRIDILATLLIATLTLLLASCVKEPMAPELPGGRTIHYSATVTEGTGTRATLDGSNHYIFEAGDKLYVTDATGGLSGCLTISSGVGATSATFDGELTCGDDVFLSESTPLSAVLISEHDRIHTITDGEVASARNYPVDEFGTDLADAVSKFSDFTATNTYGAHSFTLAQQSAFLIVSVRFDASEVPDGTDVTAKVFNNSAAEPIWTSAVTATASGSFTRASFVLAFPGGTTSLTNAELSVQWGNGQEDQKAFSLTNQSLAVNNYYSVSRSTIDIGNHFHITAKENNTQITFKYSDGSVEFSEDGVSWTTYDGRSFSLSKDDVIYFRGNRADCDCNGTTQLFTSSGNKVCYIGGEIASLLGYPASLAENAFRSAFSNGNSQNTNPANVTWVDINPDDPLILPSVTANNCYREMFRACTSLTSVPALPATEVAANCYFNMFRKCTGLTTANIELPAMTMTENCYRELFRDCEKLTSVPVFPASVLAKSCYQQMLSGCKQLGSVTCLATDISASSCLENWMQNIKSTGTFYKSPDMNAFAPGSNGIPSGWTVENYTP